MITKLDWKVLLEDYILLLYIIMYYMHLLVLTILNKCVSDKFECFFKNQRKLKVIIMLEHTVSPVIVPSGMGGLFGLKQLVFGY